MKIFSAIQIREIDSFTIQNEPILSIDLMERAADAIYNWFAANICSENKIVVFAGNGNNGGDGLALSRMLIEAGYDIEVYYLESDTYSVDFSTNLKRLIAQGVIKPTNIASVNQLPAIKKNTIIVDALFGTGLSRPLTGFTSQLINFINSSSCRVISIDIPSGLFCEANPFPNDNSIVKSTTTLTIQFPKRSFFFTENSDFVGDVVVLPIGLHEVAINSTQTSNWFVDVGMIKPLLKKRKKFDHKGNNGHCLLIAGSYGMMGAAVLSSRACIKTGSGLVTVHIPKIGYSIVQESVPEVIASVDDHDYCFSNIKSTDNYSAIGIGPGIGKDPITVNGLRNYLKKTNVPLVIDADGLNIIADNQELLDKLPEKTIITPHPGEFDRLFEKCFSGYHRLQLAIEKSKNYNIIIVLKGAYTQVVCPNGNVFFNSTGNPGMATAGSGDVLTGVITSLLGQGYDPISASIIGVYIHGLAGDLSFQFKGFNALTASDIINNLGDAFQLIDNKS